MIPDLFCGSPLRELVVYHAEDIEHTVQASQHHAIRNLTSLDVSSPKATSSDALSHTLTSVNLMFQGAQPQVAERLLHWPTRLTILKLSCYISMETGGWLTTESIQPLLDIHRNSLQKIVLGFGDSPEDSPLPRIKHGIPDFSGFSCLQNLELSSLDLLNELLSIAQHKLSSPSLHHLCVNVDTEVNLTCDYRKFARQLVQRMEKFASPNEFEPISLDTVNVSFDSTCWEQWWLDRDDDGDTIWPWDYLVMIGELLRHHRVNFIYEKPTCTRDHWR